MCNAQSDPFLHQRYDSLHDSDRQQALRRIAPMPVGVVFIQHPTMDEDAVRSHFRTMKELGFNCLKGVFPRPGTSRRDIMHWALREGIIPWWYGEGGWAPLTDELLDSLGIARDTPDAEIRRHPRFLAFQGELLRRRIERECSMQAPRGGWAGRRMHSCDAELSETLMPEFVEWLKKTYSSIEELERAWNFHHALIQKPPRPWRHWSDVADDLPALFEEPREYRRIRDVLRFKADRVLRTVRERRDAHLAHDQHAPFRAGGEMGLFLPFAARATDMEGVAALMDDGGSFYPSIHLSWHFEESGYRIMPEVYMQASLAVDWFKGGWSGPWESSGGPQQISGGKGLFPGSESQRPGFTVDEGVITQMMLSYLAAGFRGFGFWCYNARSAGWECGEYALLDRNNRVGARARAAGAIGAAAQRWRDELWRAHKEPLVGLFTDFDSDAMWAAISVPNRDLYRYMGVRGRIGAARALCRANIPWEHVTGDNLRRGLADRYRIILLPSVISLSEDLLELLQAYVQRGGRLAIDLPGLWLDEYGRLRSSGAGSRFERLFGCTLDDYQFSANKPRRLRDLRLSGFVCDCTLTDGEALDTYENGAPAVIEKRRGAGSAILLGYEASQLCYEQNAGAQRRFVHDVVGSRQPAYSCEGAFVWKLATPDVDHFFLINDGESKSVHLRCLDKRYHAMSDAITGESVNPESIRIDRASGRWIRAHPGG